MNKINSYINQHKDRFINELIELLKYPSISADSAYNQDILNTANDVKDALENAGCDTVEIEGIQLSTLTVQKKLDLASYGH